MDELSSKLTEILQDPARMQQIKDMASSMGIQPEADIPDQINQKQERLIQALLPYLKPQRQAKLERVMRLSHLSRMAGMALRAANQQEQKEEQGHV